MAQTILVLSGFEPNDPMEERVMAALRNAAVERSLTQREVVVRDLRLGHCTGCFECFIRTPGSCRMRDDAADVVRQVVSSDAVVFAGRIAFGGYAAELKRAIDRLILLVHPFLKRVHGENHHPPRYSKLPRLMAIGVPRDGNRDPRCETVFRALVGRNAINLSAPSHVAEILPTELSDEQLHARVCSALDRCDSTPWADEMKALRPAAHDCPQWEQARPRRLLSVVASMKTKPSNSGALAAYFDGAMRSQGWETESLTLKANIRTQQGQDQLVAAVQRADMVSMAFPLFVDSLHCLPTLALEILAAQRARWTEGAPKRFVAIANSGFPEAHQSNVALAICERFAAQAGWIWAGGLALGAGELLEGKPLETSRGRLGPQTAHLRGALDLSAKELTRGHAIPQGAQPLFEQTPFLWLPHAFWGGLFRAFANRTWRKMARTLSVELPVSQ